MQLGRDVQRVKYNWKEIFRESNPSERDGQRDKCNLKWVFRESSVT